MGKKHIIDCDANPLVRDGLKVESHRKGGQIVWSPERIALYLSKHQKGGKYVLGHDLRKELESLPVLNACVLDYLLAHSELIPKRWKGKAVFFWGTIYCDTDVGLCVRYLDWDDDRWNWYFDWFDHDWSGDSPAAMLIS